MEENIFGMPRQTPPDFGMVLKLMRLARGWGQGELARAAGVAGKRLSDYEWGRKPLPRERLESLIALMGCVPEQIEITLDLLDVVHAPQSPPEDQGESEELRRKIDKASLEAGRRVGQAFREVLTLAASRKAATPK